jgi:hypothetical protein
MIHGERGSLDTFWTFPPTAKARPDGVSKGWDGGGTWDGCDIGGP